MQSLVMRRVKKILMQSYVMKEVFFVAASNCGIPFAFEAATTKARALGAEYCYRAK
jgi:hypothetical protein